MHGDEDTTKQTIVLSPIDSPEEKESCTIAGARTNLPTKLAEKLFVWFEQSPLLTMKQADRETLLIMLEVNTAHAPSKRQINLTLDDYLAYWNGLHDPSSLSLQKKIEDHFDNKDRLENFQFDFSSSSPAKPKDWGASMIQILNAFAGLEKQCTRAHQEKNFEHLQTLLISPAGFSLRALLNNVVKEQKPPEKNNTDPLIIWLSSKSLWDKWKDQVGPQSLTSKMQVDTLPHVQIEEKLSELEEHWNILDADTDIPKFRQWLLKEWTWQPKAGQITVEGEQ